jgi:hypothetical protein
MIEPNMATMLGFLATDAALSPALLDRALRAAVRTTFNSITVDGDTSTNDTVALIANGASGARRIASSKGADYKTFCAALDRVCTSLALAVVEDGEGAQRVIEIEVRGAPSERAADRVPAPLRIRRWSKQLLPARTLTGAASWPPPGAPESSSIPSARISGSPESPYAAAAAKSDSMSAPCTRKCSRVTSRYASIFAPARVPRACGPATSRRNMCTSTQAPAPEPRSARGQSRPLV